MSGKPQQPPQRTRWHVYLQARAAKREWVGEIEAVDEREAIEIAAKEFKQPAKKLMAVVTRLTPEQREALELLASYPHGATEQLLVVAHGFESDMIAGLVRSGLATAIRESMKAGGKTVEVVRIRIADAGRSAIGAG